MYSSPMSNCIIQLRISFSLRLSFLFLFFCR